MGSLALLPLGYLLAGPLAELFGARTVLAVGSAIGLALLALGLASRSVRDLGGTSSDAPQAPPSTSRARSA